MSERKTAIEGTPVNDVGGLARHVPEVDPGRCLEEQARQAYEEALGKWPVLACLMGLASHGGGEA